MKTSIIGLILFFAMTVSADAESTLALQEKCSKAAKELFVSAGYKNISKDEGLGQCLWSYECHYNNKLDKCFILLQSTCYNKDGSWNFADLVNVFEEKQLASYSCKYAKGGVLELRFCILGDTQFNMMNGFEFNKQTKKWDIISEAYTNSLINPFSDQIREKFDKWIKPYMQD